MIKKKSKLSINNKLKGAMGRMNPKTNKIEINVKNHYKRGKLDKAELASTVKHETLHVKHPKMTEKEVYKKSAKTKIPLNEQNKLLAKLRMSKINSKIGGIKRKFKLKSSQGNEPGDLINKYNESKSLKRLAIKGLV